MAYDDDFEPPPRKVRKNTKASKSRPQWIPWTIGIVLFVMFGCCSGALGLVYLGQDMLEYDLIVQLRDNPKIREHLGELKSLDLDVSKTISTEQDVSVFNAVGTAGSGELTVKHITDDSDNEKIVEAKLRLANGQVIQVVP